MRDWLTKDIYWKGFSVFMAIGIWLTVNKFSEEGAPPPGLLSQQNTYTNVPVSAVLGATTSHGMRIVPDTVTVTVSGSPDVMASFDPENLHAIVNLTGIVSAHGLSRRVEVATPPRITLLHVDPQNVTVSLLTDK